MELMIIGRDPLTKMFQRHCKTEKNKEGYTGSHEHTHIVEAFLGIISEQHSLFLGVGLIPTVPFGSIKMTLYSEPHKEGSLPWLMSSASTQIKMYSNASESGQGSDHSCSSFARASGVLSEVESFVPFDSFPFMPFLTHCLLLGLIRLGSNAPFLLLRMQCTCPYS